MSGPFPAASAFKTVVSYSLMVSFLYSIVTCGLSCRYWLMMGSYTELSSKTLQNCSVTGSGGGGVLSWPQLCKPKAEKKIKLARRMSDFLFFMSDVISAEAEI